MQYPFLWKLVTRMFEEGWKFCAESFARKYSAQKLFWKFLQNSQKMICAGVFF